MTKTLTEQWREGKLPEDCYYILTKNGHIKKDRTCFYSHTDEQCFCFIPNKDIEEVLAPVPSYDEYNELKQDNKYLKSGIETRDKQIEQLEKQLEIATKALKEYSWGNNWLDSGCRGQVFLPTKRGYSIADKALDEMEGIK